MSNLSLQDFCNRIVAAGTVTGEDVAALSRDVLPDGIESRDQADLLIALERSATDADGAFADFLVASVVNFAVWGERPTGYIDREVAEWLGASLAGRAGPTPVGARIAVEVVREAQSSDEAMIVFALDANRWTRQPAPAKRPAFLLAA
ncbi:hypothetical protein [Methylobacterium sp. sgz302541]|uniref:hypothetical protein n=1 Tax=unclassified Methylobacterium TaxID=2615210 RepID=UPI003D35091F